MILPLVLVVSVVLAAVVAALATYASAGLRHANVVESRADRLASADGGLRYGIEKLRLNQSLCTTAVGAGAGYTQPLPAAANINGTTTVLNCQRVGTTQADSQGWSVVVTGGQNSAGFLRGQGGNAKTFGGPVYLHDPTKIELSGGDLTIENGDIWYHEGDCDPLPAFPTYSDLQFIPEFLRGPICTERDWHTLFHPPPTNVPVTLGSTSMAGTCKVFSPGQYSSITLANDNYFEAGEYYLDDAVLDVFNANVTAGFADGRYGDSQRLPMHPDCAVAQSNDAASGELPGATFYLGDDARIDVRANGRLEILRRSQGGEIISIHALDADGPGGVYEKSDIELNGVGEGTRIVDAQAGTTSDLVVHGLIWAPRAFVRFDNSTNHAFGMALGGIVAGSVEAQSATGTGLVISVESNPAHSRVIMTATATKTGASTSVRAVLQVQPDSDAVAINSWRVCDADC